MHRALHIVTSAIGQYQYWFNSQLLVPQVLCALLLLAYKAYTYIN